jgi:hypothetical protein
LVILGSSIKIGRYAACPATFHNWQAASLLQGLASGKEFTVSEFSRQTPISFNSLGEKVSSASGKKAAGRKKKRMRMLRNMVVSIKLILYSAILYVYKTKLPRRWGSFELVKWIGLLATVYPCHPRG